VKKSKQSGRGTGSDMTARRTGKKREKEGDGTSGRQKKASKDGFSIRFPSHGFRSTRFDPPGLETTAAHQDRHTDLALPISLVIY
jgi:hypothetical protein